MITIDFESEGINGNVITHPPLSVGVSIKYDDQPSRYYAYGHPTENNCTREAAYRKLKEVFNRGDEFLFHNVGFDMSITRKELGIDPRQFEPTRIHDTRYMIFLKEPYATSFSLKPSAERILHLPPEEQDELKDWILRNVAEARKKPKDWAAWICRAPGNLVGKYAKGDTDRTWALYDYLYPDILRDQMLAAYRREQLLFPILYEATLRGTRLNVEALEKATRGYDKTLLRIDDHIRKILNAPNLNIDGDALADALDCAGKVNGWIQTPGGKRSTSRPNLLKVITDHELYALLSYRAALHTCLTTFAHPWLALAQEDGRLHPNWNQIRGNSSSKDMSGARTGRMSCQEPNFTNISTEFEMIVVPPGYPELPRMRRFILPEEGHVWIKRDFSAQEMRIMAHFAEGTLAARWNEDPDLDPHQMVSEELNSVLGISLPRKPVKVIGFGIMYGRGNPALSAALGVTYDEAKDFRNAYFQILPEIKGLDKDIKHRGRTGGFIRTWGGRMYYVEPPKEKIKDGQFVGWQTFEYKLLNYLIQGSAADQTKQSIITWNKKRAPDDTFHAAVHDEINISAPEEDAANAMERLRKAMDRKRFDVPFRSEGYWGWNWNDLEKYDG